MNEEKMKILNMLSEGKITPEEAAKLMEAVGEGGAGEKNEKDSPSLAGKKMPKFLVVRVDSEEGEKVNVRVPLKLLRAGMKLGALLPEHAKNKIDGAMNDKGIDFDFKNMGDKNIDELIETLAEFSVDVSGKDNVKITCE